MEDTTIQRIDPETEFLASKQETGYEWETFKENVRPLKRGRNVKLLNDALKSNTDHRLRKSLIENRRKLIEAIDEYQGDDPLKPWIECIKWVQEAFPPGGDFSGLVVIYEQCVRSFWHSERYKDDLRYLKVWLEYAEHCADREVIFAFLDANGIGKTHVAYYIAHALHMESKAKMRAANEIFSLGISRNAQPMEKLKDAYQKFLKRSMKSTKVTDEEDSKENQLPARSFGTLLTNSENTMGRQTLGNTDIGRKKLKANGTSISIYEDTSVGIMPGHQPNKSKADMNPWNNLGSRAERNKENNAIPSKWTSFKVPQRTLPRAAVATGVPAIEVFVDEDCGDTRPEENSGETKTATSHLRRVDGKDVKKETELLRANPLRNFPLSSLPR